MSAMIRAQRILEFPAIVFILLAMTAWNGTQAHNFDPERPDFDLLRRQGRPDGGLYCPRHSAAFGDDMCTAPPFSDILLAQHLSKESFEACLTMKRRVGEQRVFEKANADWQMKYDKLRNQQNTQQKDETDRKMLAEQLKRQFPNAFQCGKCGHGPIDHMACANLRTHHGEQRGTGRISNACPACGWFSPNISDWPAWDGQLPESADVCIDDNTLILTQITNAEDDGNAAALVAITERNASNANLLSASIRALGNMSATSQRNRAEVFASGGVAAVLAAMNMHSDNADVARWGCNALGWLANDAEIRKQIAGNGGVAAVLAAMNTHSDNAEVARWGCYALGNLANDAEIRKQIAGNGGVAAVLAAMNTHSGCK